MKMGGFVLSLFTVVALLLPTPQAGAGLRGSTWEQPCVSVQPPCPPDQPDEQTPPFSGTIDALQLHNGRIAALTALAGTAYTIFSEWMNTKVLSAWTYAEAMPTLELAGLEIGASPLAQWLLLPPLALYLARKTRIRLGQTV